MLTKTNEQTLRAIITPTLERLGFDLVCLKQSGPKNTGALQIMIENKSGQPITLDDCARLNRALVEEDSSPNSPLSAFDLEVSSPGIDRPLIDLKDYKKFQGYRCHVTLTTNHAGQRRFKGYIESIHEEQTAPRIGFRLDTGSLEISLDQIAEANLSVDDVLKRGLPSLNPTHSNYKDK